MTVLYLSGWRAGPDYGWAPWLRAQLAERGVPMVSCSLPHSLIPITRSGVSRLTRIASGVVGPRILIAHSFGAKVALKALSRSDFQVDAAIFVAPLYCWPLGSWFRLWRNYIDFERLQRNCPRVRVVHSRDDRLVPFRNGEELVRLCATHGIDSQLIAVDGRGHFDPTNGCRELPEVLGLIDSLPDCQR